MTDVRMALYEPDIPQNTGAILRLGACLGVAVDIIEPCGFVLDDRRMRRAGMDYLDRVAMSRHASWEAFLRGHAGRLVLLTTQGEDRVPGPVHNAAEARVVIPMTKGARSLNVAVAAAMALGEALRQTGQFSHALEPETTDP